MSHSNNNAVDSLLNEVYQLAEQAGKENNVWVQDSLYRLRERANLCGVDHPETLKYKNYAIEWINHAR